LKHAEEMNNMKALEREQRWRWHNARSEGEVTQMSNSASEGEYNEIQAKNPDRSLCRAAQPSVPTGNDPAIFLKFILFVKASPFEVGQTQIQEAPINTLGPLVRILERGGSSGINNQTLISQIEDIKEEKWNRPNEVDEDGLTMNNEKVEI